MRISFLVQDLCCQGAEYVTAMLVRGFVQKGYDVDLLLSQVHYDLVAEGKTPYPVPATTNVVHLPARRARQNIAALRKYLRQTDSQTVIVMAGHYMKAIRWAALGLRKRPQIVYVEHGPVDIAGDGKPAPALTWREKAMSRFYLSGCDRVLTVSRGTMDAYVRRFPWMRQKLDFIYNPVVDELFFQKLSRQDSVHPWLSQKSCPTFVAGGAHNRSKNHFLLFQAIQECLKRKVKVRLVLFGRGQLTKDYSDFIAQNHLEDAICLAGFTDNLPLQLKHADGFVHSSIRESFAVVLVEALAAGCFVVSTRCPYGPSEIINDPQYGTLVPVGDAIALADAIQSAAKRTNSVEIPEKAWRRFSLDEIVGRYERILGLDKDRVI